MRQQRAEASAKRGRRNSKAYERAQVREALANGMASDSTAPLEKRFAAFRMLRAGA
jgi:hypothetical protein